MTYWQYDTDGVSTRACPGAQGALVADGAAGEWHAMDSASRTTAASSFSMRVLPHSEYRKLVGTELETLLPHLPNAARVLVIETPTGQVIGCWGLMPIYHAEGLWIHPAHRGRGRVALRLLEGMRALCRSLGVQTVATASVSEQVDRLVRHLGAVELPGRHFVFKV